jgi:hypothetical protein
MEQTRVKADKCKRRAAKNLSPVCLKNTRKIKGGRRWWVFPDAIARRVAKKQHHISTRFDRLSELQLRSKMDRITGSAG